MYGTILLATDGSDAARRATERAVDLAATTGATLHAVSVVDVGDMSPFADAEAVDETLHEAANTAVDAVVERAREADVPVVRTVLVGVPHRAIRQYVEEERIGLVVVGTHGRTGLARTLIGSVAARVVRTAPVPVLVVP